MTAADKWASAFHCLQSARPDLSFEIRADELRALLAERAALLRVREAAEKCMEMRRGGGSYLPEERTAAAEDLGQAIADSREVK